MNQVPNGKPADVGDALGDLLKLKTTREWNDAQLAAVLGVEPAFISAMLSGKQPVSIDIKRKVWARLTYDLSRETVLRFLPTDKAKAIIEADIERGRRNTQRAAEAQAERAERKARSKRTK